MVSGLMRVAFWAAGAAGVAAVVGCAQESRPMTRDAQSATPREPRSAPAEQPRAADPQPGAPPEPPTVGPPTIRPEQPPPTPEPIPPAAPELPEPVQKMDGPPSWWISTPRWEGARVTVGAAHFGATVPAARLAALELGEMELVKALGRKPEEVEVTRVQVVPAGDGYRAYVLVVGQ
jgi:hypothetical protein